MGVREYVIDWEASKLEWIDDVSRSLLPRLVGDKRFPDAAKLVRRFEAEVAGWSSQPTEARSFRGVINIGNELAAAFALLDKCKDLTTLRYEPPLRATAQTIDFCLHNAAGDSVWIDVKTVAPQWQDDDEGWKRFERIAEGFPENACFGVQRAFGGAGIFGQAIKARWSFVTRTIEVEEKALLIPNDDRGPVWLMLCTDGSWHLDDLEDFADFYRAGRYRDDDWASNAMARYLTERNLSLSRSLTGFHYFKRRQDECDGELRWDVQGPTMFAPH